MPTYRVTGIITGTIDLGEVVADTEEAAMEKALDSEKNHVCLCYQCARELELDDYSASSAVAHQI